ncbi:MAG: aminotransferase class V-fold PLP-dependent enzyme [Polyangiaceae bacterium]|nr:aminotransferase class V-fold PLP-dependent enzyme [Polyangiaceae bacterium]
MTGGASPRPELSRLRAEYGAFLSAAEGRILLTGHSHQAWPDAARDALCQSFDDAARFADDKWQRAVFPLMERVGRRVLGRLGFSGDDPITFGKSTHELVYRLLSALPADARVVTTTSEFHSLHRQLGRLAEDGLRVCWVEGAPRASLPDRLIAQIAEGAELVALSAVFFEDAYVLPRLGDIARAAREAGAILLVDAYHAFNVVPLELDDDVYLVAGGYKYGQLGEGVCFLRSPRGASLRPRYTGWFADFGSLEAPRGAAASRPPTSYGAGGARFAGATFDPASFYRADAVLAVLDAHGLEVKTLRAISVAQTERIAAGLERGGLQLLSSRDPARRGGFVSALVTNAHEAANRLRERGVFVDARGDALRLGPAPYLTDEELDLGVAAVIDVVRAA